MNHWKTTAWGVLGIVALGTSAVVQWHSGKHVDVSTVLTQIGGIAVACGLIPAADAGIVNKILNK